WISFRLFLRLVLPLLQGGCARRVVSRTYLCTFLVTRGVCKVCVIRGIYSVVLFISIGLYSGIYFMNNLYFIFLYFFSFGLTSRDFCVCNIFLFVLVFVTTPPA